MILLLLEAKGHDRFEKLLKEVTWDFLKDVPGLETFDKSKTPWESVLGGGKCLSYEAEFDRTINDFLGVATNRIIKAVYAIATSPDPSRISVFGNEKKSWDNGSPARQSTLGPLCSFQFQGNGRVAYRSKNRHIHLLIVGFENGGGGGGGVWQPIKKKGL